MMLPPHIIIPPAITSPFIKAFSQDELDVFLDETEAEECRLDMLFLPRSDEGLLQSFYSATKVPEYKAVFAKTPYAELVQASPWFFELDPKQSFWNEVRQTSLSWGALLIGKADEETAIGHWRSLLNVVMPDDTISHFRFYSSKVLFYVANACTEYELVWLCGPNSYIVLPMPENTENPWTLVSNPLLAGYSTEKIAMDYQLREKVWWHVTTEHLAPFKEKTDAMFVNNMVVWLWQNHADETRAVHQKEVNIRTFVEELLPSMEKWGFHSPEQKQRCVAAMLLLVAVRKSADEARSIFARAAGNPERALYDLEQLSGIR
jgi:hypothetical protein